VNPVVERSRDAVIVRDAMRVCERNGAKALIRRGIWQTESRENAAPQKALSEGSSMSSWMPWLP